MEKRFSFQTITSMDNGDILDGAIVCAGLYTGNFINNVHPLNNLPEDRVFCVEEVIVDKVDEELAPPGVGAGVCHGDRTPVIPVVFRELILDRVTGSAHAGAGRVTALDHKTR